MKDLFSDLLNGTKGFKYQITKNVLLKKYKLNEEIKFTPVYFNLLTKTAINHRFRFENSFQETLNMIDVWINKGSGWNFESTGSQYINISTYKPLSGSSCMSLPVVNKKFKKRTNQHKKKRSKMFLWSHVRHINPSKEHPERIKKN